MYTSSLIGHRFHIEFHVGSPSIPHRLWKATRRGATKTYAMHSDRGCCLYIITQIWTQKILGIALSKLLFVHSKATRFFFFAT